MYQITHNKLANVFHDYFNYSSNYCTRRNVHEDTIFLPRFMTTRAQHSIKFTGTKIWNSIPQDIKKLSFPKFKLCFKELLLHKFNLN